LTAKESSIGSSGGTTEVMMRIQSSKSLPLAIPLSNPDYQPSPGGRSERQLTLDPDVGTCGNGENE